VLVAALENPDPQVRIDAIQVARSLGGKVAIAVLRWAVKHGQPEVQLQAVSGLGAMAQGDVANEICELLEASEFVEVQRECCLALGKLQTDRAVPALSKAVRAGGLLWRAYPESVRTAAAWALGQMKANEEARKALERALEDKNEKVKLTARLVLEGRA
jgi:HEAT repeat protein